MTIGAAIASSMATVPTVASADSLPPPARTVYRPVGVSAVWPLMRFTNEKAKMGEFVNPLWIKLVGWGITLVIITLNVKLLLEVAGITGGGE